MPRLAARPAAAVPSRAPARPRRAEKDQGQRVEIAGFRFRKAANSSNAVRGLAEFPANREFFAIQQGILFARKWPGRTADRKRFRASVRATSASVAAREALIYVPDLFLQGLRSA